MIYRKILFAFVLANLSGATIASVAHAQTTHATATFQVKQTVSHGAAGIPVAPGIPSTDPLGGPDGGPDGGGDGGPDGGPAGPD